MQRPREDVLQLKDGSTTLEAKSLDDLAAQLRQRYPDGEYEPTLHRERDRQAEQQRADAMNNLIDILVHAVVRDLDEQAHTEFLLQGTDPATELRRVHAKRLRSGRLAAEVNDSGEEMQAVQAPEGVRGV